MVNHKGLLGGGGRVDLFSTSWGLCFSAEQEFTFSSWRVGEAPSTHTHRHAPRLGRGGQDGPTDLEPFAHHSQNVAESAGQGLLRAVQD